MKRSRELESTLSHARLCEVLHYDPETGYFTWIMRTSTRMKVGSLAGSVVNCTHNRWYVQLSIDYGRFLAHRVAWFYMTGAWPEEIDHKDGDGTNNRWANLRECTHQENIFNMKCPTNNTVGARGIMLRHSRGCGAYRNRNHDSFVVHLGDLYIGSFRTLREAKAAREVAARKAHGDFYNEGATP